MYQYLPSGNLTWLLKMSRLWMIYYIIYPINMVMFHSYANLPEGIFYDFLNCGRVCGISEILVKPFKPTPLHRNCHTKTAGVWFMIINVRSWIKKSINRSEIYSVTKNQPWFVLICVHPSTDDPRVAWPCHPRGLAQRRVWQAGRCSQRCCRSCRHVWNSGARRDQNHPLSSP